MTATLARQDGPAIVPGPILRDRMLGTWADILTDLEAVRIANENRVEVLTRPRSKKDSDGEYRGHGLHILVPELEALDHTLALVRAAEEDATRNLRKAMRKHPLSAYQKRERGVGEKQLARLLAAVGDPYWHDLYDRPRRFGELKAYCGVHVVDGEAVRYKRGVKANWNAAARMRLWLIASNVPKFPGSTYEIVYRDSRARDEGAVHGTECKACAPKGKVAPIGSALGAGHLHRRAVRLVSVAILKDLYNESRRLHEIDPEVS